MRWIERAAVRLQLGAIDRDAPSDLLRRGILIENKAEAASGGTPDRGFAAGGDPERRMGLLRRRRLDYDVVEGPEFAAVGKALARGPCPPDDFECLLEPRVGLLARNAEAAKLVVAR